MAAIANTTGRQQMSVEIPRIVSDYVVKFRQKNLQFVKFITNRTLDVASYGQTVDFPVTSTYTAFNYVDGNRLTDNLSTNIDTKKSLTVNQMVACPVVILDSLSAQSKIDAKSLAVETCGYQIAKYIDDIIADEMANFSVNTIQNGSTPTTALTKNHMLDSQKTLDALDAPTEDRVWFYHPNVIRDLMADTGNYFTSLDFTDTQALVRGQLQYLLLGSPIVKTTNLNSGTSGSPVSTYFINGYFHKSALAIAMQKDVEYQEQYDVDYQGTLINARTLFGTTTLRPDHGVLIYR
jgi:hypothetical protein